MLGRRLIDFLSSSVNTTAYLIVCICTTFIFSGIDLFPFTGCNLQTRVSPTIGMDFKILIDMFTLEFG